MYDLIRKAGANIGGAKKLPGFKFVWLMKFLRETTPETSLESLEILLIGEMKNVSVNKFIKRWKINQKRKRNKPLSTSYPYCFIF